ncbi:J domain-containing protein [Terrimonas sp. NA20]|uniref:J domain-containing protein n=1 Tax=Terrimonas ginsenosidimutans TaxID=2908004 RepID=A0ABS9KK96_9BACT|nr:J domain-containing protein [Terrimonas ginsenosidimutans]MCG2612736.1 J domain-containing protein [Terrimonas ginsenosidimutans]
MFIDYYELLELSSTANSNEVQTAFRRQALKWHPDENPGLDTTLKMQLINEAKLILLDTEAREKYDHQYLKFKLFQSTRKNSPNPKQQQTQSHEERQSSQATASYGGSHTSFEFEDELLKKWMRNAKTQAVDLAKQTIDELRQMSKTGIIEGMNAMGKALLSQIVISVMVLLIIALIRGCS